MFPYRFILYALFGAQKLRGKRKGKGKKCLHEHMPRGEVVRDSSVKHEKGEIPV